MGQHVDQPPARRALAMRPRDRHEAPTERRVGHQLLPGLDRQMRPTRGFKLRMVGVDRRQGLGHGEPGWPVRPTDVGCIVAPVDRDPGLGHCGRVGRRPARIAAGYVSPRGAGQQGCARCPRPGNAHDVDAGSRFDRPGVADRCQSGADLCGSACHGPSSGAGVSARSISQRSAARTLSRRLAARSPAQV